MTQPDLFQDAGKTCAHLDSTTFKDNMKLPLHRWYRYTAGFSGAWAGCLIEKWKKEGKRRVLDPFAGSGTVLVESLLHDVDSYGLESNPYVYRIANAKLRWCEFDLGFLYNECISVLERARKINVKYDNIPNLITRCFPLETLQKLEALKRSCLAMQDIKVRDFVWFIITAILRSTSPVGTAQWQYIQPKKKKSNFIDPFVAYQNKLSDVFSDIRRIKNSFGINSHAEVLMEDSRNIVSVPDNWADMVITSPPYANNYDYADAMRLEMLFWNDISGWKDLQDKVSVNLIRACTQHVSQLKNSVNDYLDSPLLAPIKDELEEKYALLKAEREVHGGKKNYHTMIVAYFFDMAQVFKSLNRVTTSGCRMCFVIGDSAPYGVYIPVDEWLGKLAKSAGFGKYSFEKLRDRNIKWKNRKHRVPLKEGNLWINK